MFIDVGDLKMAREALCAAQSGLNRSGMGSSLTESQSARIGKMIDQIDTLRPLGPDGKHGNRHTPFCGCDGVRQDQTPYVFGRSIDSILSTGKDEVKWNTDAWDRFVANNPTYKDVDGPRKTFFDLNAQYLPVGEVIGKPPLFGIDSEHQVAIMEKVSEFIREATNKGMGLRVEVGNFETVFFADNSIPVGQMVTVDKLHLG